MASKRDPDPDPSHLEVSKLTAPMPPSGSERKRRHAEREAFLEQARDEWMGFPNLPGAHFALRQTDRKSCEYVNKRTNAVEIRCSFTLDAQFPRRISYRGETYVWRRVGRRRLFVTDRMKDLVNARTGASMLRRTGVHSSGVAGTRIVLGEKEYTFPVRGEDASLPMMSAVDGSGNRIVEYREKHQEGWGWAGLFRPHVEAVVSREALAIPHIHLLVVVSSRLIRAYCRTGSGA